MVPIVPGGAVELMLFREPSKEPEVELPDEDALKAHGRMVQEDV